MWSWLGWEPVYWSFFKWDSFWLMFVSVCSFVTCTRMTLYLINLSVVLVGMACVLQLVHTGISHMFLVSISSHAILVLGSYCRPWIILRGRFPFSFRLVGKWGSLSRGHLSFSWYLMADKVVWNCLFFSNLFRVFGASPGSEEASTLEASKSPNRYLFALGCWCDC